MDKLCTCGSQIFSKSPLCNSCAREYMKLNRKSRIDSGVSRQDVYNYRWRKNNPEKYIFQTAKSRAKKKGVEFNISLEDIVIPSSCPVLGIPLFIEEGFYGKGKNPNNPSLDRIDPNKGYIKGNVQVISWRANDLKKNGTLEEFKKLVEFLSNA